MSSYVAIGTRGAVAIHRSFACTRDELPREIVLHARSVAPEIGTVFHVETYSSRNAADTLAAHYTEEFAKRRVAFA
jgi:hypothetical protein